MLYLNDDIAGFDFEAALPLLSEQRRQQALKFKHEQGRKTCAMAYLLLCKALRQEYGITELPVFEYGEHGKPCEAVICVVSNRPVGVDVESIREYRDSLVRYTMNDQEVQQIERAERPDVEFIRLWTMKEAVLKLSGRGIVDDLKHVLTDAKTSELTTVVDPEVRYMYSICRL